ncbi:PREDICTED: mitochondrial inner membrane protein COX18 [Dinoponera quadriceps]|uniref:Mitochondrial inner membrane protein COX18 n=1 Tax=Dinoponera quadriceps TaxID=609295 RepID=A0A6P3XI09_DINQU|nr:PREDICTED: mitochondrial inner membrane protein COX18 [Dinoponera quadriceps]
MNKTKLQDIFSRGLKQASRVNINNTNSFKTPSRTLLYTVCNNYSTSCANTAQDLDFDRQQPVLLNNVIKRYSSIQQSNFSYMSHPRIISPIILCNGDRYVGYKIYHGGQSYNSTRYFSSANIDSVSEIEAPMQLSGIFKTISESMPIKIAQDSLLWMHDYTGLPWWLVIILTTGIIRTAVTLPLSFYQHCIIAKLENLKFEMNEIVKEMKKETNYGVYKYKWPKEYAKRLYIHSMKKQWNNLIVRENCHPAKSSILVLVQVPLWVSLSVSIRNLCYMLPEQNANSYATHQEFTTDGFLWITNLTVADPFVLPIAMGLCNLAIIEINHMSRTKETTKWIKYMTYFARIVAIGIVPIAMCVPSCVSLYWATSCAFGVLQNLILLSPKLRRFARVPITASESPHPYSLLREKIIARCSLKRKMETSPKTRFRRRCEAIEFKRRINAKIAIKERSSR